MTTIQIGQSPLYELLSCGAEVYGFPLRSEPANHTLLSPNGFEQRQESWHSGRSTFTKRDIEAAICSSEPYSLLVDLPKCGAAKVETSLNWPSSTTGGNESHCEPNLLEKLIFDVSRMKPTTPGKMLIVVACDSERTKDSYHIQDRFGAQWSYLGDPSVMVLGLVPGEQPFLIERVEFLGDNLLKAGRFRMEQEKGHFAERLCELLKKTLMALADPNSYSLNHTLWSNFYSVADTFALLKSALEAKIIKPGFSIKCYGPEDRLEFSIEVGENDQMKVASGIKEHGFVPHFCKAVYRFLRGELIVPMAWTQENACMLAALFVSKGTEGYYAYRLLVYASFCQQLKATSSLKAKAVHHSRIMDECFGRNASFSWPNELPRYEHSNLVESVFKATSEVELNWFGVKVRAIDVGEMEGPAFDNDAKGSASKHTLKRFLRVDGINTYPGHGIPVRAGSDLIRFKLGGQRIEMTRHGNELMSSVRFQTHNILDPLVRIREVEVAAGKLVWADPRENGLFPVSNAMLNNLLAGMGGRKISMWILARILHGDIAIRPTKPMVCYCEGATVSEEAVYEIDAPLDAKVLAAMHTYTDGNGVWVDFKDNGKLKKIVRTTGRFCNLVNEEPADRDELRECGIRSTLRAK